MEDNERRGMSLGVMDALTTILVSVIVVGVPTSFAREQRGGLVFVAIVVAAYVAIVAIAKGRGSFPKNYWAHLFGSRSQR